MSEQKFTRANFQQYLDEHKLMGARCQNCRSLFLPPRQLCPACYSEDLAWEPLSGKGRLAAFTAIHIGPKSMIQAGYDRKNPYFAGIVRLEEGPAISAQIFGLDTKAPEKNMIGKSLQVDFYKRDVGETGETILAFKVADTD
jgi:uncharacterized OB-fold protein